MNEPGIWLKCSISNHVTSSEPILDNNLFSMMISKNFITPFRSDLKLSVTIGHDFHLYWFQICTQCQIQDHVFYVLYLINFCQTLNLTTDIRFSRGMRLPYLEKNMTKQKLILINEFRMWELFTWVFWYKIFSAKVFKDFLVWQEPKYK